MGIHFYKSDDLRLCVWTQLQVFLIGFLWQGAP